MKLTASTSRVRLAAASVAALALTLTGCASTGDDETVKVALLLPDTITPRYENYDRPYFEEGLKTTCADCVFLYNNADSDASVQRQQAEDVVTNGAGAIVINPVDSDAAAAIAQTAADASVPLISIGRLVQNADIAWSVTMDVAEAGRLKAQALVDALKANGTPTGPIVMINGAPGDTDDAQMKAAAKEVFEGSGVEIAMEYDTPDWDPSKAQEQMDQAITSLGRDGFTGVYSSNDGMAGGAIAAMKSAGIDPSTRPITGLDADVAALQRIIAGDQYMTVFQDIHDMAFKAAEIAVILASGEEPGSEYAATTVNNGKVDVPTYLYRISAITQDNINDELFTTGFVSATDVCTADFADACEALGIDF